MSTLPRSVGGGSQRDIFADCAARRHYCILGLDVKLLVPLCHVHTRFVSIFHFGKMLQPDIEQFVLCKVICQRRAVNKS